MKPQESRYAPRAARFSRLPLNSARCAAAATSTARYAVQQLRGLLVLAVVALFALLQPGKLFAQQASPGDRAWSQNDQYNGQYAPNQQSVPQSTYAQQPGAQPSSPDTGQVYSQQGYGQAPAPAQPLNAAQLEQLVAPIALYPDALVAQVLAASTYPGQVADADHWRQAQPNASPDQIVAGADAQNWDPSVKALTAFPLVLERMDRNLPWTADLGNAYYNQPQDVLEAVQVMRRRAQAAGTLQSTPQQAVQYDRGYIQLMPVDPQVVYIPSYDPWTVYGEQVSPYPGFSLLGAVQSFLGSSPIHYGLGIAMSAFSHSPWGWLAWGLNWLTQSVLLHQSDYSSQSDTVADWGFRHDGPHAYAGWEGFARHSYERTPDSSGRLGSGYNGNRGQGFGRPPDRYAENWRGNSNRGFQANGGGYYREPRPAYNRLQAPDSRQQSDRRSDGRSYGGNYGRDYGTNSHPVTGEGYRRAAGAAYDRSMPAYRAPSSSSQRVESRRPSSRAFASRDVARSTEKPRNSTGFHPFGGRHEPKSVSSRDSGGYRMARAEHPPKNSYSGGKHSGGSHSHGGGGHSGGHGGGKHHR